MGSGRGRLEARGERDGHAGRTLLEESGRGGGGVVAATRGGGGGAGECGGGDDAVEWRDGRGGGRGAGTLTERGLVVDHR